MGSRIHMAGKEDKVDKEDKVLEVGREDILCISLSLDGNTDLSTVRVLLLHLAQWLKPLVTNKEALSLVSPPLS